MTTPAAALSVQDVVRQTGLSEATLRYYERIGLIPEVPRDPSSRHRRYSPDLAERLEALACLRGSGMGIDDMRSYLAAVERGDASLLVGLFSAHEQRLAAERAAIEIRRQYVASKARLWQARLDGDADAAAAATAEVLRATERLQEEA